MEWKQLAKTRRKNAGIIFIIVLLIILTCSIIVQIKFERCIKRHQTEYGLLQNRKRLKWTPAIVYLFNNQILNRGTLDIAAFNLPYEERGYKIINQKNKELNIPEILDKYNLKFILERKYSNEEELCLIYQLVGEKDIHEYMYSYIQLYVIHCYFTDQEKRQYIKRKGKIK